MTYSTVDGADTAIWSPERSGKATSRVRYPGFPAEASSSTTVLPGHCVLFQMQVGDVVSLTCGDGLQQYSLTALSAENQFSIRALGLDDVSLGPVSLDDFYSAELVQRMRARGLAMESLTAAPIQAQEQPWLLKATAPVLLILIAPGSVDAQIAGTQNGEIRVQLASEHSTDENLPEPLGQIRDEFRVDRATARSYELKEGEIVQIIDVQGQQCSDFMAMNAAELDQGRERYIDSAVTRTMARGAYPAPGLFDKFFDQDMKPLLAVVQDTIGRHDTFALACTARGYEERGFPGHINCSDNISDAYEPFSIRRRRAWPAINFFFNSWIHPDDNRIQVDEAWSRPGDYVAMRALRDVVCVSTACPDDVDPINGWNPTDIHVRIYKPDAPVRRAIAYRATPDADPVMTKESAFHPRTSVLTQQFSVARDVWAPSQFDATGAVEEYWNCRNAATIQDMSSLRKLDVTGPDAERLMQKVLTRDVSKVAVNRGFYALICDDRGSVVDDGTLFRLAPDVFRWCCGSDESALHLKEVAEAHGLRVWVRDLSEVLANVAIQGPKSREILSNLVFTQPTQPRLDAIKWFGFCIGRLHDREGASIMVARSGYTGELGYEIFCHANDALSVWDAVIEAGAPHGLKPMGGDALELMRVEAGLMAAGAEFGPDVDPDESGLGFAVDLKKADFIGKAAIERNRVAPRRKLVGLLLDGEEAPIHGDGVFVDRRQVGVITSAVRSPELGSVVAMARVAVENATVGEQLEVGKLDQHSKRLPASVTGVPFIDPTRLKARA